MPRKASVRRGLNTDNPRAGRSRAFVLLRPDFMEGLPAGLGNQGFLQRDIALTRVTISFIMHTKTFLTIKRLLKIIKMIQF